MSELNVRAISEHVGLRREARLSAEELPLWLARLHQALPVDDRVRFTLDGKLPVPLDLVLDGGGFGTDNGELVRLDSLPDVVGAGMKVLVCGLNPSPHAADSGVGFSRPGNRFWPAALDAGLVRADRDPQTALVRDCIGFTDLVKRPTKRADELGAAEFRAGLPRLQRLVDWLQPASLLMVGLGGWRAATADTSATSGWQPTPLGRTPVYLMPNTSGLNAHETKQSLADHLRSAMAGPPLLDAAS